MRICIIHRYPIQDAILTNPSMPYFLNQLSKNHKVTYLSYKDIKPQKGIKDINFEYLPSTLSRKNSFDKYFKSLLFIFLTPFISWKIKKTKINIVYCDDSLPFYAYLIKTFTRLPVITRLGDLQTGYLFLKKGMFGKLLFKIFHKIEVHTWKTIDGIIPISKAFGKYVLSKGISPKKVTTVLECVDTDIFKPEKPSINIRKKYGLSKNDTILMYHGVVEPLKGLDILLKMIARTLKQNKNVKFFFVGDGSSVPKLKVIAKNLEIYDSVVWTNWVFFSEIVDYINSCDIGIPMRSDNFANNFVVTSALLQYWACSKPIIAPRLESFEEVIGDGENGYLFDFDNIKEFEEKLDILIKNAELRKITGENGNMLVNQKFESSKVGNELSSAINYLIDSVILGELGELNE